MELQMSPIKLLKYTQDALWKSMVVDVTSDQTPMTNIIIQIKGLDFDPLYTVTEYTITSIYYNRI